MESAPANNATKIYPPSSDSQQKSVGKGAEAMAILAQIPDANTVEFEPLQTDKNRPCQLRIPPNIDITNPYQLFSLFYNESLWEVLANNTNFYAYAKASKNYNPHARKWYPTTPQEIKVFIGVQIYMGFTSEPELKDYWREDSNNDTIHANHPLSRYMTQYRYEQLRRFFYISTPPEVARGYVLTNYPQEPTPEQMLQLNET